MKEQIIQYEIVTWFGQTFPQFRGLLFELNNDTYSAANAMRRRSMGMISGLSDLGLIIPEKGNFAGIEIKSPGSTHKVSHIRNQLAWGEIIKNNGGFYIMSSNIVDIMTFMESLVLRGTKHEMIQLKSLNDIQEKLRKGTKTIKF